GRPDVPNVRYTFSPPVAGSKLKEGSYTITAVADGFKTESKSVVVTKTTANPLVVPFHLEPEPVRFELVPINPATAKVTVDSVDAVRQDNVFVGEASRPGVHTVQVFDGDREVLKFDFNAAPGAPPVLQGVPQGKDVLVIAMSIFVNRARVYASSTIK